MIANNTRLHDCGVGSVGTNDREANRLKLAELKYQAAYVSMVKSFAARFEMLGGMKQLAFECNGSNPTEWEFREVYKAYCLLVDCLDTSGEVFPCLYTRCYYEIKWMVEGFDY
jgi:hypothetical protein